MRKIKNNCNTIVFSNKGSITVYLILCFIIFFSLITALITVLRFESEKVNGERTLNISLEKEFSKYYLPLFNDYGLIYFIEQNENDIQADILSCFVENQRGISSMLQISPQKVSIENKLYATDNSSENVFSQLKKEALHAMADESVKKVYEMIKSSANDNKKTSKQLDMVNKDVDKAEKDAEVEKDVINLLKLVEGINVCGKNIECEKYYAKQGLCGKVTADNAGVDSSIVWNEVKENYWDITETLIKLKDIKFVSGKLKNFPKKEVNTWTEELEHIEERTQKAFQLTQRIKSKITSCKGAGIICDIDSVNKKLEENVNILNSLIGLGKTKKPVTEKEFNSYYDYVLKCFDMLSGYHVRDIKFDYSTLVVKKADNPIENQKINNNGILKSIIGDINHLSNNRVSEAKIYEKLICGKTEKKNEKDYPGDNEDLQTEYYDGEALSDFLDNCKESESADTVEDSLLLNTYIDVFVKDYLTKQDKEKEADALLHALNYEKEYIIAGNESDYDNLDETTKKILYMRAASSFIYLVCDKESSNLAYVTAAALVGFTGMDALIRCVKYMILAVWAYDDACVDTGAILKGKRIQIIKNSSGLNVSFAELPLFNKEMMQQKINELKGSKGADYDFFLQLFLAVQPRQERLFRCMDIIQNNMKLRYDTLFSFQNAIYGVKTNLVCDSPFYNEIEAEYLYK